MKDHGYDITLGDSYESFACVDVYKNSSGSRDIALRLGGADQSAGSFASVTVKKYLEDGTLASSGTKSTESANMFSFWLRNMSLDGYAEIAVYDSSGGLIFRLGAVYTATFTPNEGSEPDKEGNLSGKVYFGHDTEGIFSCTKNESEKTLLLRAYSGTSKTLEIPGQAIVNEEAYDVYIRVADRSGFFLSDDMFRSSEIRSIRFVEVNHKKVLVLSKSMYLMFYECSSLSSVDMSGLDTKYVEDMERVFATCTSLISVDASGWDTGNVTTMYEMFNGCSSLTSVNVSGWDTGNVTDMIRMFAGCISLTSVDVNNWDTGNVENMSDMFAACYSLTNIDMSGMNTGNVTDMREMFFACNSLTSVDMSGMDTGNVKRISSIFEDCISLTNVDVSGWDIGM